MFYHCFGISVLYIKEEYFAYICRKFGYLVYSINDMKSISVKSALCI